MGTGASTRYTESMKPIVLEIPEDIVRSLRVPEARAEEELRREFAVFLVKEGLLSRPKARVLAGMERIEFEDLLARRQVAWEGSIGDVTEDVDLATRILKR